MIQSGRSICVYCCQVVLSHDFFLIFLAVVSIISLPDTPATNIVIIIVAGGYTFLAAVNAMKIVGTSVVHPCHTLLTNTPLMRNIRSIAVGILSPEPLNP